MKAISGLPIILLTFLRYLIPRDHSSLRSNSSISESLFFYQELLGLKIITKNSLEDCDLYFLGENETDCQIELTYNYETPQDGYKNGNAFVL